MRKKLFSIVMMLAMVATVSLNLPAQNFTKIQGKATDEHGQAIVGAKVELSEQSTGRHYSLKTGKKGDFFSIGIVPGKYRVVLLRDGKELFKFDEVQIANKPDDAPTVIDFDLQTEKAASAATAGGGGVPQTAAKGGQTPKLTEEQKKEIERINKENEKVAKENETIKGLNQLLAQARAAMQAGNYDQAISALTQATQADPGRDLLWGNLGDAYLAAAKKETDSTARKEKYTQSANAYKKAIDLASASADPRSKSSLGAYYNNMGEGLARTGQTDAAVASYNSAIAAEPTNAQYAFNLGASLMNAYKPKEAAAAFDKVIAVDPTKADAYYWKANALLNGATLKDNKTVLLPGTTEAFNKYLEIAPDGPRAEEVKATLSALGAPVETKFSNKKKK